MCEQQQNVSKGIDRLSEMKYQEFQQQNCQILISRDYNIANGKREIAGAVLSIIEDSFPIKSKNNIRWIIQQIVHGVSGAHSGLPKPQSRVSKYTQTKSGFQGDKMKIDFHVQSYVYGKNGELLDTDNVDAFTIRMVIGIKHDKNARMMAEETRKLLKTKEGMQLKDQNDETPASSVWSSSAQNIVE